MASTRRKIGVLLFLLLTTLGLLTILVLPRLLVDRAEELLRERVARQDKVALSWEDLSVSWTGVVTLKQVELRPKAGGSLARIAQMEVHLPWRSLAAKRPRITRITLAQADFTLDLADFTSTPKQDAKDPHTPGEDGGLASTLAALQTTSPHLHRLLRELPEVSWTTGLSVTIRRGEMPLGRVDLEPGALKPEAGTWRTALLAKLTFTHPKAPRFLRAPMPFALTARATPIQAKGHAALGAAAAHTALFSFGLPRVGRLSLGGVELAVDLLEQRHATAHAQEVVVSLGEADDPILEAKAASVGTTLLGQRRSVSIEALDLGVNPSKLGELGQLPERMKQPLFQKKQKKQTEGALPSPKKRALPLTEHLGQLAAHGQRLSEVMGRLEGEVRGGKVSLLFSKGPGEPARTIEVVRQMRLDLEQGHFSLQGTSAGGKVAADALFLPGLPMPLHASLDWQGVRIDAMPGMTPSRTLPSRGPRGRLGGQVDLKVQLFTPMLHMLQGGAPFDEALTLEAEAKWRQGVMELHGLADAPLEGIELEAKGRLVVKPGQKAAWIEQGLIQYNGLDLKVDASLKDWELRPLLQLEVGTVEVTPCQRFIDALPPALLGPYAAIEVEGQVKPLLRFRSPLEDPDGLTLDLWGMSEEEEEPGAWRRWRRRPPQGAAREKAWGCAITGLRATQEGWPKVKVRTSPGGPGQAKALVPTPSWRHPGALGDVYWMNKPFVKAIEPEYLSGPEVEVLVGPGLATYVPLGTLPRHVPAAAYLSEEILFYQNRGISLGLIEKALRINLERGRFVYGGSTVTQQLVKNLFLSRHKTLARKLQEALISLRIDEVVSKDRVLELYLNCIEFGPDLYGIGPASRHYFGKEARDLTPMEAVFLAVIKPSPSIGERLKRRGQLSERDWLQKRIKTIFERLVEHNVLTTEEAQRAQEQELLWEKDTGVYTPTWAPGSQDPPPPPINLFDF